MTQPEPVKEDAEPTTVDREEVDVGEIEIGVIDYIPTSKRGGGGAGSKYKFASLDAPTKGDDGKTKYTQFTVKLQPGVDEQKLKRSVQSATTQANKHAKDAGSDAYYITRTVNNPKTGAFEAIMVIRTDTRSTDETSDNS